MMACLFATASHAQNFDSWSESQSPFKVYGNTYYVGTKGLASVLIASADGHILIDGALPESATMIAGNIATLGFRIEDVKLILNTHVHFDHAGGIAGLQKRSGAQVAASAWSAKVLLSGVSTSDDPQSATIPKIEPVANVRVFKDKEVLKVGSIAVTAHLTPGHTPGGTSWTWISCEANRCLNMVYADSLNAIGTGQYRFTDPTRKPNGAQQLEYSFGVLNSISCDVLITPHPEATNLLDKLAKREQGATPSPFIDIGACRRYVAAARARLQARIADEAKP